MRWSSCGSGQRSKTLPQLADEGAGPFDLIFIDADKANYPGYFEWSLELSRPGTLIIVDNVVRDGAVIDADASDPEAQRASRASAASTSWSRAEPRVSATAIQTVGAKGHDGFALMIVEGGTQD